MKKSPFLSVSRFAKILRKSQSKKSNKKMLKKEDSGKKKTTLKKKKSKKKIIDGNNITLADKIKKMKTPIQFFKTILNHHDKKNIIPSGDITETTKEFFKEFFEKFQDVKFDTPTLTKQSVFNTTRRIQLFDHIDDTLRKSVEQQMETTFTYSVDIGRPIHISISVNKEDEDTVIQYVKMILFWLHIVTQYTTKTTCSNSLSIYLMLSDLKKVLKSPECSSNDNGGCVIKKTSVNTGYSNKCSHIVIYRKEEWFKVFIHETIHNYGLDFSFRRQTEEENILKYFGITSHKFQVRLYEAYTESWARIMNALLHAFNQEHKDFDKFMKLADENIQLERLNAYFQTAKILNYMKLDMDNLKDYNEETSNLSYYFIVCMLYSDYQDYILWSRKNNDGNILQFNNSVDNQQEIFVNYIKKCHQSPIFQKNLKYFKDSILKMEIDEDDYLRTYMKKSLLNESSVLEFNFLA